MGFLYFLPIESRAATEADLEVAGLGYALATDPAGVTSCRTTAGPDGGAGLVVTTNRDKVPPVYAAAAQTWRKGPGGKYWIGLRNDVPRPGPEELARARVFPGEDLELADGRIWTIPRCHGWLPGRPSALPRMLDVAEDGETPIHSHVMPPFKTIAADAANVLELWAQQPEATPLTVGDEIRIGMAALGVNYRVGPIELALLEVLESGRMREILLATCDVLEAERRIRAKNEAATPAA